MSELRRYHIDAGAIVKEEKMDSRYINALLTLEQALIIRIHNEIEEELRGRGDSEEFKESIRYRMEERLKFINKEE